MQIETSFKTETLPAKYAEYKYNILYLLSQVTSEEKRKMIEALAAACSVSVRMIENYIYARKGERGNNLSEEKKEQIANVLDIDVKDIENTSAAIAA